MRAARSLARSPLPLLLTHPLISSPPLSPSHPPSPPPPDGKEYHRAYGTANFGPPPTARVPPDDFLPEDVARAVWPTCIPAWWNDEMQPLHRPALRRRAAEAASHAAPLQPLPAPIAFHAASGVDEAVSELAGDAEAATGAAAMDTSTAADDSTVVAAADDDTATISATVSACGTADAAADAIADANADAPPLEASLDATDAQLPMDTDGPRVLIVEAAGDVHGGGDIDGGGDGDGVGGALELVPDLLPYVLARRQIEAQIARARAAPRRKRKASCHGKVTPPAKRARPIGEALHAEMGDGGVERGDGGRGGRAKDGGNGGASGGNGIGDLGETSVDHRLWLGAFAQGWRVVAKGGGHFKYVSPNGKICRNKAEAVELADAKGTIEGSASDDDDGADWAGRVVVSRAERTADDANRALAAKFTSACLEKALAICAVSAPEAAWGSTDGLIDGTDQWEVERLVKRRVGRMRRLEYLVRWKGWSEAHDSWEPKKEIDPMLITEFEEAKAAARAARAEQAARRRLQHLEEPGGQEGGQEEVLEGQEGGQQAETMPKRPRGRAPKGKTWDAAQGCWVAEEEAEEGPPQPELGVGA